MAKSGHLLVLKKRLLTIEAAADMMCEEEKTMLKLAENNTSLSDLFWSNILGRAKDETREEVAAALRREFHSASYFVHVGGHHVALINSDTHRRMILVTGTSPDFSDRKPQDAGLRGNLGKVNPVHPQTFVMRSISRDIALRYKLCEMISVSRELHVLRWIQEGYPMVEDPKHWTAKADPRVGHKYTYILLGSKRHLAIEHETGKIFLVNRKSQTVNRGRQFGTLDTIEDWAWGWAVPRERVRY